MYKKYYSHLLTANPHFQHYAGYNHYYWPDVTREATLQYWDDSAKWADNKWSHIFGEKIPSVQKLISDVLNISHPERIIFSSNTHDFVYRMLYFLAKNPNHKIKILTTDSEFHCFESKNNCLYGQGLLEIEKVSTQPFDNFERRFIEKIQNNQYDMIFFSQVFFNSGMAIKKLENIIESVKNKKTLIVIDATYGFMALPTDLSAIADRVFYISGSHGSEGANFMAFPKNTEIEPMFNEWPTGLPWDYSAIYRLEAVLKLFKNDGITIEKIHSLIQRFQNNFRNHLLEIDHHYLTEKNILSVDYNYHGHFLTFAMPSMDHAKKAYTELRSINIITDFTGNKLRFGFGIYQNECIDLTKLS